MKVKRRTFLAALGVSAVGAAACTPTPAPPVPPPTAPPPSPTPTAWPGRPGDSLAVEAVVFDGAFGTSFVRAAGERLTERTPGLRVRVTPVTAVATEVGPRFAADATPPDLVGNSGADALPISALLDELLSLDDLLATMDLDAPYPGAAAEGQRGRAGTPKRPALPDRWLDTRDMAGDDARTLADAELDTSGG